MKPVAAPAVLAVVAVALLIAVVAVAIGFLVAMEAAATELLAELGMVVATGSFVGRGLVILVAELELEAVVAVAEVVALASVEAMAGSAVVRIADPMVAETAALFASECLVDSASVAATG
jgi:hypothetical protein